MMPLLQNPVELKSRKNVLKNKFLNVESYFAFYLYYMIYPKKSISDPWQIKPNLAQLKKIDEYIRLFVQK